MSLGIECLLAVDPARALELATRLERLNRERREIEVGMQESALAMVAAVEAGDAYTLSLHRPRSHAGGVGLLRSRLQDSFPPPVVPFPPEKDGKPKGSGRSTARLYLPDALDGVVQS